ncbi:hypothetical protein CGRA01v4_07968 [Colletotrichum graminicola]|nr:hypothetical protein CGRA01v4_07968 [Colletotrichum graminicola]
MLSENHWGQIFYSPEYLARIKPEACPSTLQIRGSRDGSLPTMPFHRCSGGQSLLSSLSRGPLRATQLRSSTLQSMAASVQTSWCTRIRWAVFSVI